MTDNFRANIRNPWVLTRSFVISLAFVLTVQACYQLYDAAQQRYAYDNYQPARDGRAPIMIKGQSKPHSYEPNCKQPQNREDADLCAQWSAVTQVTEANRLASLSLQLSIGALIFTVIGTSLLVWTLQETRQSSRRELRAYVSVQPNELHLNGTTGEVEAHIKIRNDGSTPAYKLAHMGNFFVGDEETAEREIMRREPRKRIGRPRSMALPVGGEFNGNVIRSHKNLTEKELSDIAIGASSLYCFGTVEYEDTFGKVRSTRFCFVAELDLPDRSPDNGRQPVKSGMRWMIAPFHNESD